MPTAQFGFGIKLTLRNFGDYRTFTFGAMIIICSQTPLKHSIVYAILYPQKD